MFVYLWYGLGAWTAATADTNQFLTVTFDHATTVTHILTQGHRDLDQWVTSYRLEYEPSDGSGWTTISKDGSDVIFEGNFDRSSAVFRVLPAGITTLGLRINPLSWSGAISLRWQLYGCYEKRPYKQEVHTNVDAFLNHYCVNFQLNSAFLHRPSFVRPMTSQRLLLKGHHTRAPSASIPQVSFLFEIVSGKWHIDLFYFSPISGLWQPTSSSTSSYLQISFSSMLGINFVNCSRGITINFFYF